MNSKIENQILKFIGNKKIIERKILSSAFNINCEKIKLNNNNIFIAKYYNKKNNIFNSIKSEINSLIFLNKIIPSIFPLLKFYSDDLMIINYIDHNNLKGKNYQEILSKEILKLHLNTSNKYGFNFDSQIGGLRQENKISSNWVDFFKNQRLNMIFNLINKENSLPKEINSKIELLLRDLENRIPKNPVPRLLHGDLWSGNILFNNKEFIAFIDPGIYYGHNELEIAYLTWFNYIDKDFIKFYSNVINVNKDYYNYEPIYQLYFSLLNVHLWDRNYILNVEALLKKLRL